MGGGHKAQTRHGDRVAPVAVRIYLCSGGFYTAGTVTVQVGRLETAPTVNIKEEAG